MLSDSGKWEKAFTLIELMVVLFIIGILSAVAIPLMRGRTDAAKWSEGKSGAGSVNTAARAYIAEKGNTYDFAGHQNLVTDLGFATNDLDGRYFKQADYGIVFTNSADIAAPPVYTITVTRNATGSPEAPSAPVRITLDNAGLFTEYTS